MSKKNWRVIPEHPWYDILRYTNCQFCPKFPALQEVTKNMTEEEKEEGKTPVFIEHFPPEYAGDGKRIMLVGESPGHWEMCHFKPFVGRAGQILRNALRTLGYVRKEPPIIRMLITNSVKCRCVGPPHVEIMSHCSGALAKEAELFSPDLIIALGKTAFHALTDKGLEHLLGENRKKHFEYRGFPVRLTYHPAAALRNVNHKISLYQDLRNYLNWILRS